MLPKNFKRGSVNDFRRWLEFKRLTAELEASANEAVDDAFEPFIEEVVVKPKVARMLKREQTDAALQQMIDYIRQQGPCTVLDIASGTGVGYTTVVNRVAKLEGKRMLKMTKEEFVKSTTIKSKFYSIVEQVAA